MDIVYGAGLLAALVVGGTAGWLSTTLHAERAALRQRDYERELAESRDLLAARAALRRGHAGRPGGTGTSEL